MAASLTRNFEKVDLLGIKIDSARREEVVAAVLESLKAGHGGSLVTPNLDHLRQCSQDSRLADLVNAASLVVPDGMPLIWASRLQGGEALSERVSGSDLVEDLASAAAELGSRVFLLGGAPGAAAAASRVLERRYPGIVVVGTSVPMPGFLDRPDDVAKIVQEVRASSPDLVYVGLPFPLADDLVRQCRVAAPRAWFISVGVSFSFVAGRLRRAPVWIQRMGLEWLFRLCMEPKRLFKRYIRYGLPFAVYLFYQSLRRSLRSPQTSR